MEGIKCKCVECRHSNDHLTYYHKCGKCERFGHGQYECPLNRNGDMSLLMELKKKKNMDSRVNKYIYIC
jgi:hypothetical protein